MPESEKTNTEINPLSCENCKCFSPTTEAYEERIKELENDSIADKFNYESWQEIKKEHEQLTKKIKDLQEENKILTKCLSNVSIELVMKYLKEGRIILR